MIARFARNFGSHPQDVDDVIQEVLTGFFAKSPTFVYDPSKGRFRSYLKTCACNVLRDRAAKDARFRDLGLRRIDPNSIEIEQTWNDLWEQVLLQRAVDAVRGKMGDARTFRAFELYVILDHPAEEVAKELEMHIDSVYPGEKADRRRRSRRSSCRSPARCAGRTPSTASSTLMRTGSAARGANA